jgi:ActR/RegA family two-component response regulator
MTSPSVLVVEDDATARDVLARALHHAGCRVDVTGSDHRALSRARQLQPDLALVGPGLSDTSRTEFVRELRGVCVRATVVVVAGGASVLTIVGMPPAADGHEADSASIDSLVPLVLSLTHGHNGAVPGQPTSTATHAAERWAAVVVPVIDSPRDPKTLRAWGRWVAASPGAIRNWCRTANISAKRSLNFARMLRAVERHRRDRTPLEELLDVVDRRTLVKLCRLGAPRSGPPAQLPPTVEEYLRVQRWIDSETSLAAIRRRLAPYLSRSQRLGA